MASRSKLLWVGQESVPQSLRRAASGRWDIQPWRPDEPLAAQLSVAKLAVIQPNGAMRDPAKMAELLGSIARTAAVAVLLIEPNPPAETARLLKGPGQFLCVCQDASSEDLATQIAAAESLQPAFGELQNQLEAARKLGLTHPGGMRELDEEMRLAARLQRDFLPRRLPDIGPVRFGALYRPASWLSGDIYDVTRLDERHVGFYVADAVGHGMPAALLTIFIKRALQTKRIVGNTYEIIPPAEAMSLLNVDISQQNLSSCQFCTAVYFVLDSTSLELTYCRAGHPQPLVVHADGQMETLNAPGSLLGIFPEEIFEGGTAQLRRGDRLIAFTDGAEEALRHAAGRTEGDFGDIVKPILRLPREELLLQLTAWIDSGRNCPNGDDDVTILIADIDR